MKTENYQAVQTYCGNCGYKCIGYRSRDRTTRFICDRCGACMVSKLIDKRTVDTRMTAPPGQEAM
jgi:hypothetical protein